MSSNPPETSRRDAESVLSKFERPVTALVAGASRGVGLAFVRGLAE